MNYYLDLLFVDQSTISRVISDQETGHAITRTASDRDSADPRTAQPWCRRVTGHVGSGVDQAHGSVCLHFDQSLNWVVNCTNDRSAKQLPPLPSQFEQLVACSYRPRSGDSPSQLILRAECRGWL